MNTYFDFGKRWKIVLLSIGLLIMATTISNSYFTHKNKSDERFISYTVDTKKQEIKLYWKNERNENHLSLHNLKTWLEKKNKTLVFAMNGGMYKSDFSPQGLYIENSKVLSKLDTTTGTGNFYLKPNGVFYVTNKNTANICTSAEFIENEAIKYATQSGPMLVINGTIHPAFNKNSTNINIRNGVGILPNNRVVFAMSKKEINLYDFATYFINMGCKNALYLDGFVSRTYLPVKNWKQTDGNFGVIIGVCKD